MIVYRQITGNGKIYGRRHKRLMCIPCRQLHVQS